MITDRTRKEIESTRDVHEFLTFLVRGDQVRAGVVQNVTPKVVMFYDLGEIKTQAEREEFLQLADEWWWESNHSIPVDSFLGERFEHFRPALKGYPRRSIDEIIGPTFSLQDLYLKRVKKKRIEIVSRRLPGAVAAR